MPARDPNRLRVVSLTETCGNCATIKTTLEAEIGRLRTEVERLTKALRRESHVMDPREPHRRKA